jgi:hypothetical protein
MPRLDTLVGICCAGGAFGVVVDRRPVTHRSAIASDMIFAQNSENGGDDQHVPEQRQKRG